MLDTVAVDDELHALARIKEFIVENDELNLVGGYIDSDEFLAGIREQKISPQLVFLDIEMPGSNGLELAQKILEINEGIDIVFVTAYSSYAVEAFELNALDYLLKPITQERFQKTISRLTVRERLSKSKDSKLEISTFGHFKLLQQGKEIEPNWATEKSKELFLYLLHHRGNFVRSSQIMETLWPNRDPDKVATLLYSTVYSTRKVINKLGFEGIILSKRGYYKLNLEEIKWDLFEFENLVSKIKSDLESNIELVTRITELYQGQYLANHGYRWLYGLQTDLEKTFKSILLQSADYYTRKKSYQMAIMLLEKIVKVDFFTKDAHQKLINIYKEIGEKLSARDLYQNCKKRWKKEFGFEPDIKL